MKWTVALFGHYKYRYELRENKLSTVLFSMGENYQGIEQFREEQVHKTISRHVEMPVDYDTEKYFVYSCTGVDKRATLGDIIAFKPYGEGWSTNERKQFLIITMDNLTQDRMNALCETYYDLLNVTYEDIEDEQGKIIETAVHPGTLKKRRFCIPLSDFEPLGVNINKVLDKELLYSPQLRDISKLECYDKKNSRYVLETDSLNTMEDVFTKEKK